MAKIFLCDPALKDLRGHHYNLSLYMTRALREEGHRVICLANKNFSANTELEIVRCFASDTYDAHKKKQASPPKQSVPANQNNPQPGAVQPQQNNSGAVSAAKPAKSEGETQTQTGGVQPNNQASRNKQSVNVATPTTKPVGALAQPKTSLAVRIYRLIPLKVRLKLTPFLYGLFTSRRFVDDVEVAPKVEKKVEIPTPGEELLDVINRYGYQPTDIVFFHTSDAQTYRDVLDIFVRLATVAQWNKLPTFRLSTPYDDAVMPHNKILGKTASDSVRMLNKMGLIGSRIFLYAENQPLAQYLGEHFQCAVAALPIPPNIPDISIDREQTDTFRIGYLGPARTEKGFVKLPELVANLLADKSLDVEIHIQITPQILGYTADVKQAVDQLKKIEDSRLVLFQESMSTEAYVAALKQTDLLVLNYQPHRYRVRSSGIAVESILFAINVVATADTIPAYYAGDAGIAVDYDLSSADAVRQIIAQREQFRSRALARRERYLEENSAAQFSAVLNVPGNEVDAQVVPGEPRYEDGTKWRRLLPNSG